MENPLIYSKEGHRTRLVYILESSFDNCAMAAGGGVFLTMLLTRLGISDSLNGIIATLSTLACTVQMFAYASSNRCRSIRRYTIGMYIARHLSLLLLFLLPFLPFSQPVTIGIFIFLYLGTAVLYNLIYPNRFNWMMSFVPSNERGGFTANYAIVVLVSGMGFIYAFSAWVDHYTTAGQTDAGLLVCAVTIAVLAAMQILTLSFATDLPPREGSDLHASATAQWKEVLQDRTFRKLLPVAVIYTGAVTFSSAFFAVYELQELHFSLKFIALLNIIGAASRSVVSRPFGRYADTHGWPKALTLGFVFYVLGMGCMAFTVPSNGRVMFIVYELIVNIGSAITGTGIHTIVFAFVPEKLRTSALGLYSAAGGVAGFGASLLGGLVIAAVQGRGLTLLGRTIYAQQVNSVISALCLIGLIVYMLTVVQKLRPQK